MLADSSLAEMLVAEHASDWRMDWDLLGGIAKEMHLLFSEDEFTGISNLIGTGGRLLVKDVIPQIPLGMKGVITRTYLQKSGIEGLEEAELAIVR